MFKNINMGKIERFARGWDAFMGELLAGRNTKKIIGSGGVMRSGIAVFDIIRADGTVELGDPIHNITTWAGMDLLANLFRNASGSLATHIGLGTSNTAEVESQTTLIAELATGGYAREAISKSIFANANTYYAYTASADGAADGSTLIDASLTGLTDLQYSLVKVTQAGSNQNYIRRVASFNDTTDTLTFMSNFPAQILNTHTFEIHVPGIVLSQATFTKTTAGSWAVEEAGLFTAVSSGTMICRLLTGTKTINQNDSLVCKIYSLFGGELNGYLG